MLSMMKVNHKAVDSLVLLSEIFGFKARFVHDVKSGKLRYDHIRQQNGVVFESRMLEVKFEGFVWIFVESQDIDSGKYLESTIVLNPKFWNQVNFSKAKSLCAVKKVEIIQDDPEYLVRLKCFPKLGIRLSPSYQVQQEQLISQPI